MNRRASVSRVIPLILIFITSFRVANAAAVPIAHGSVELIAEDQSISPGANFYLGLHFKLEKGWHIYWQNPGDSGQPPRADWKLPSGFSASAMEWPMPRRMGTPTIVDYGYNDDVTILVPMHASSAPPANNHAQIAADLRLLICREICVPGKAQLSLDVPVHDGSAVPNPKNEELFAEARKSLPRPVPATWKVKAADSSDSFVITADPGHVVKGATFFPYHESQIDNAAPQKLTTQGNTFRLVLHKSNELLKPIHRLQGVLVSDEQEAYVIDAPVGRAGQSQK